MMKKVWLILMAMVLVFGLALLGCGSSSSSGGTDPDEPEDLVEKVVYDMKADTDGVQKIAEGDITFPASGATPIDPLVKAGEVGQHLDYFKAVKDTDGKIALAYKSKANWGPGIDLTNAAFGFRAGDKIEISGTVKIPVGGKFQLNKYVNSENSFIGGAKQEIEISGPFSFEVTLAEADMDNIRKPAAGGGPAGIRIECRTEGIEVQINQIKITGMRPSNIVALDAPIISIAEDTVSWADVDGAVGYALYKDADTTPFKTVTDTSYKLAGFAPGTYKITVVALGVSGVSKDSAKSNEVTYVKEVVVKPEVPEGFTILGEAVDSWWGTEDSDNNPIEGLTFETFIDSKYLILDVESKAGQNGFGGIQLAIQGDADGYDWHQTTICKDWNQPAAADGQWDIAYSTVDSFYIIVDLASLVGWEDIAVPEGTTAKIKLNSIAGQINIVGGYLVSSSATLNQPGTALPLSRDDIDHGWASKYVFELKLPASFFELGEAVDSWWGTEDSDNNPIEGLTFETFIAAKYLILDVESKAGQNGFGGIQLAIQGDADGYDWHQTTICKDWNQPAAADGQWDIAYSTVDSFYIIVDLASLVGWEDIAVPEGSTAKIKLNSIAGQINIVGGYLSSEDMILHGSALPLSRDDIDHGWASKTVF